MLRLDVRFLDRDVRFWSDVRTNAQKQGLVILFAYYFALLWNIGDTRVRHTKLLLLSATQQGRTIDVVQGMIRDAGLNSASVTVQPDSRRSEAFSVVDLFSLGVADKCGTWGELTLPEKAWWAANAMADYLWRQG